MVCIFTRQVQVALTGAATVGHPQTLIGLKAYPHQDSELWANMISFWTEFSNLGRKPLLTDL